MLPPRRPSPPPASTRSPVRSWPAGSKLNSSLVTLKRVLAFSSTWSFRRGFGRASCRLISGTKMAFEIGIELSKPTEEQIIAILRVKLPALKEYSNEEIPRRVEAADVLAALGTLRRIPVLHNLTGLVDPELLNTFDLEDLRQEKTIPLQSGPEGLTVAVADPYGDFRVLYEKRFPGVELSLALTYPAQISVLLAQNQRIQQITQDEIRQLETH